MIRKALRRFKIILIKALKRGTTPQKLAITCALGVVLSVFPIYGVTTLLCFLAAIVLRLNIVIIQAVNYALTPLQLLLVIPFMQSGIFIFNLKSIPLDFNEIVVRSKEDFRSLISELGEVLASGIAVWALVSIPVFFGLFALFKILFLKAKKGRPHKSIV